jgi:tetratricopeptide (TPR) repeat protein
LNLQQTNFNIPHWYTEALATLNEGYPRPESWNQLLVERFKNDKLFDLETINFGFIRAHSGEEWNLAYCQAELYAEYMLKQFGEDALAKMLAAYADNLTTREAIPRAFNVDQADFERGYKKYIGEIVAGLSSHGAAEEKSLTELQAASKADPKNSRLLAELALAQLRRKQYPEARRLADAARKLDAREQLAAYVRARLHLLVGENAEALKMLEDALDIQAPQSNLLGLLAGLRLRSENYSEAARLYELGAQREPETLQWSKSLAAVYLKSGEKKKLAGVLVKLAENDADDLVVRKKLAQLALEAGDYATAEQWAYSGIQIDVMDLDLHRWRAEAAVARQQPALAVDEYQVAIELAPDELPLRLGLATTLRDAGRRDEARAATKELLQRDPKYPGADALLQELQ